MAKGQKQPRPPIQRRELKTLIAYNGFEYYPVYQERLIENAAFERWPLGYKWAQPLADSVKYRCLKTYRPVKVPNGWNGAFTFRAYNPLDPRQYTDMAYCRNRAKAKLHDEINDNKNQIATTLLAERKEAVAMISHRLYQAYYALQAFKKKDYRAAINTINLGRAGGRSRAHTAAQLRLEFVYGWAPFTSEIYNLCTHKADLDKMLFMVQYSNPIEEVIQLKGDGYYNPKGTNTIRGKQSVVAGVEFMIDSPAILAANRFGLTNPQTVLWEAAWMSFVIDWFVPIGPYLEQYETFKGLKVLETLIVEKFRGTSHHQSNYGEGHTYVKTCKRKVGESLSFYPYLKNPISTDHALNALALIKVLRPAKGRDIRFG